MKPLGYLLLPLGILIGLGIGLLIGGAAGEPNPTQIQPSRPALASATSPSNPEADLEAARSALDSPGTPQTVQVASRAIEGAVQSALSEAQRGLEAPSSSPAASGKLNGQVVLLDGAPLAGVRVQASPLMGQDQGLTEQVLAPTIQPTTEALTTLAGKLLTAEAQALTATSDGAGLFTIGVESDRVYRIALALPGWRFSRLDGEEFNVVAGAPLKFLATPLARLELDLVDSAGQPLASAVLAYEEASPGSDWWRFVNWKRGAPQLELNPGDYRFIALSAEAQPWCPERSALWLAQERSDPQVVSLSASLEAQSVRWQLAPRPTLYGRIETGGGEPVRAEGYSLALVAPGAEEPASGDPAGGFRSFSTSNFLLTSATSGTWDLRLRWKGSSSSELLGRVDLPSGNLRQDFRSAPRDAPLRLYLIATGPDGQALDRLGSVGFWTRGPSGSRNFSPGPNVPLQVGPGRFELRPSDSIAANLAAALAADNTNGGAGCEVQHPLFGNQSIKFRPGQSEYQVTFSPTGTLSVELVGGSPAKTGHFYTLTISLEQERRRMGLEELFPEIGPSGSWSGEFKALQPGRYRVALMLNQGNRISSGFNALMDVPVDLLPGPNRLRFDLSQVSDLRVRVPGGAGGRLQVQPTSREKSFLTADRFATIDPTDLAVVEGVAPGTYLLIHDTGFMSVDCPCGEQVFTPQPANCRRVVVLGAQDSALQLAGLRSGDLIIAVDGLPYDANRWATAIDKQAPERQVRLTVERADGKLEVSVNSGVLAENRGGFTSESFRP
jgi:hypothetical protein